MSAASIRRQRDPFDGNQKTSRALTPISNPTLKKSSSGKEKLRPKSLARASVTTQKPLMRPVPPVEKSAAAGEGEARVRWSTSTAPRGRSPNPSDFIRAFSDLRKDRGSKASVDREKKLSRDSKANGREENANEGKENRGFGQNLILKVKENGNISGGFRVLDGCYNKGDNLGLDLVQSVGVGGAASGFEENKEKDGAILSSKFSARVRAHEGSEGEHNSLSKCEDRSGKTEEDKSLSGFEVLGVSNENGMIEEVAFPPVAAKYPSKLHEKLAFLEGKVKRIASDIKKTKEMLEMNNPDASKLILSDIQDKISGIEKAVNHVVNDSDGNIGYTKSCKYDGVDAKVFEMRQSKNMGDRKILVKSLSVEELEARLFPHHKLLRNRTSVKASSGISEIQEPSNSVMSTSELKDEKKPLSPIEDNPIALEFLASLDKEQCKDRLKQLVVYEMDGAGRLQAQGSSKILDVKSDADPILTTDERLEDFDDQENRQKITIDEEIENTSIHQLNEIGHKIATGGWFVSEGEAVLLAHDDGSCSFYDIANSEEKSVYKPPAGISPNMWRDCWIIRAPCVDGCSGRYVVAASAGNSLESGFCSWDFYTKDVRACQIDSWVTTARKVLGPLPNNTTYRRNVMCNTLLPETKQWWYRPCGPLIIETASSQNVVKVYDIRDGEQIMKWEVQKPVLTMDYSSPLQWRNRGKIVVAETDMLSLWDVNSLHPQALTSVASSGRKISALHINNTDAEIGGGIRQRVSSSEAEGNDGVFCTADSINILDFRHPSGIGSKIPKVGVNVQSVFSSGDSVFLGCNVRSTGKSQTTCQVQQFSLSKQRLFTTYSFPESSAHLHHSAITQVWGNSNHVMGVNGLGLFVFDALKDNGLQSIIDNCSSSENVREVIGPDDLYCPSFDYLASRVLLISRDRPALWRHLS